MKLDNFIFYYIPSVIFLIISILIVFDIKNYFSIFSFYFNFTNIPTLIHTQSLNLEGCPDARVNHYFNLKI